MALTSKQQDDTVNDLSKISREMSNLVERIEEIAERCKNDFSSVQPVLQHLQEAVDRAFNTSAALKSAHITLETERSMERIALRKGKRSGP